MKLWVDDMRQSPDDGWTWAKSYAEAIEIFANPPAGGIPIASLDHDLGYDYWEESPSGYDIVKWIWANDAWPKFSLAIHTDNPVGRQNMMGVIERYGPYIKQDPYTVHYGQFGMATGVIYTT